jgi:cell division protein ZapE
MRRLPGHPRTETMIPTEPLAYYEHELGRRGFVADPAQREAVLHTQALYESLVAERRRRAALLARLRRRLGGAQEVPFPGLYLWGGVGRGKTWIVDSFFQCLPFEEKLRLHFHRFMRHVHQDLKAQGRRRDPLKYVADRLAARALVLCVDEFHVSDITDAMLLGGLLEALFRRGVTLVATSNEAPDQLYRDGLQRQRFVPAIELLQRRTRVVRVDGGVDYRMRYLDHARIWHCGLGQAADEALNRHFEHLAPEEGSRSTTIEIEGRRIPIVRRADSVVWFDFSAICGGPRSALDYIEIARQFQTVLISNIPVLDEADSDPARRFITLVDELYDRNVRLVASAAAMPDALYRGRRLAAPFRRTASRLVEMQSREYLSRGHSPG